MYTVFVRGLEFYAYHGVPDEEQAVGHRYRVDLTLNVEGASDTTDSVHDTVDYGKVAQEAASFAQETQFRTVEKLAAEIGRRLLEQHPLISSAGITVAKRLPPAPVVAEEAGVVVTVTR